MRAVFRVRTQYLWLAGLGLLVVLIFAGDTLWPEFMSRYRSLLWSVLLGWGIVIPLYRACVFMRLGRLGKQAIERGDFSEAERCYAALVKKAENLIPGGTLLPAYLTNLGIVYRLQARYAEAEALHKRAQTCWKTARKQNAQFRACNLANLALVYHQQARYDEADAAFHHLLDREAEHNFTDAYRVSVRTDLAESYSDRGRHQQATPLFQEARAIAAKKLPAQDPSFPVASIGLADCYARQGRTEEALDLARESLSALERIFGHDHYQTAVCYFTLAEIYRLQGTWLEAEASARRALAIWDKSHGRHHPVVARGLHRLALILGSQGRLDESRAVCQRALSIRADLLGREHPDTIASGLYYGDLSKTQGRKD